MDKDLKFTVCNCHSLRKATRHVTQLYDRMLAPLDLRVTQYSLLAEIDRLGPTAINPLADSMIMDRTTLGHNLRPLEARGYVRLEVSEDDRRSRQVSLTPAGRAALARAEKLWQKAQDKFDASFGRREAELLRKMLRRVTGADLDV
jgi:DNA-binding MarR family transcriptional regulator